MPEVIVRKGEPIDRALKRLKNKLDAEGIMEEVRRLRAFETPSQKVRRQSISARLGCASTWRPIFRIVSEVMGPMLAVFMCSGHGSFNPRKFSTVDELVKVTRSAPSARNLSRPPETSFFSGTVR